MQRINVKIHLINAHHRIRSYTLNVWQQFPTRGDGFYKQFVRFAFSLSSLWSKQSIGVLASPNYLVEAKPLFSELVRFSV